MRCQKLIPRSELEVTVSKKTILTSQNLLKIEGSASFNLTFCSVVLNLVFDSSNVLVCSCAKFFLDGTCKCSRISRGFIFVYLAAVVVRSWDVPHLRSQNLITEYSLNLDHRGSYLCI